MLDEPVLVDSGALIALYSTTDPFHEACLEQAKVLPLAKAYTCWPVITEASYLLRRYFAQREQLLNAVHGGDFSLLQLHSEEVAGLRDIIAKYHDQEVDLADAALVYLADREGMESIFTTDRRHFSVYRKRNGQPFRLLPEIK
jgi:hypothetical protein